jgi:hypothetical protein
MYSIGEETYAAEGKMELTDEYTWIVDPIDVRPLSPLERCLLYALLIM